MKKVIFGLLALMMCCFMTSCSTDYVQKAKDIVADIEKNGNDWDAEKWESVMEDAAKLEIAFYKSEPSKEAIEEYNKVKIESAFEKLSDDAKLKAFAALMKIADKYKDELEKAEEAAKKAAGDKDEKKDAEE
jgi:hypothetical protein